LEPYRLSLAVSAVKELRALPGDLNARVATVIDMLRQNPRPAGVRKLQGHRRMYRVRVGEYRVVCEVDDEEHSIRVTRVRHRSDAYW
jgi:mRNA interferase RelE/StbE